MRGMRHLVLAVLLFACAVPAAAQESISVRSLTIRGIKAVDEDRLKQGLTTRVSSRWPWGRKHYFDRQRFDTDLKRIETFYADRGYPNARVVNFDVKLDDKEHAVDLTITLDEGAPVRVTALTFTGFDQVPVEHLADL